MRERGLVPFAALIAGALLARPLWEPRPAPGTLVQVDGDVPTAAWFKLAEPHTAAALAKAGWHGVLASDLPLADGDRVHVEGGRVTIHRADAQPLVGDRIDLRRATEASLAVLPGVGPVGANKYATTRERAGLSRRQSTQLDRYAEAP